MSVHGSAAIGEIIADAGWTDNTVRELVFRFVEQQQMLGKLALFLREIAEEEAESDCDCECESGACCLQCCDCECHDNEDDGDEIECSGDHE